MIPDDELELEFLDIAGSDLEAAKVLYEEKLYAQAAFFFQQSVEKAAKAMALHSKKYTGKELQHAIRHSPINFHTRLINDSAKRNEVELSPKAKQLLKEEDLLIDREEEIQKTNQLLDHISDLKTSPQDVIFMSEEEIRAHLDDVRKFQAELEQSEPLRELTDEDIAIAKQFIVKLFSASANMTDEQRAEFEESLRAADPNAFREATKAFDTIVRKSYPAYVTSITLSAITHHHAYASRYPEPEFDMSPISTYTEELPFVKLLPEMMLLQEQALDLMNELQDMTEEQQE